MRGRIGRRTSSGAWPRTAPSWVAGGAAGAAPWLGTVVQGVEVVVTNKTTKDEAIEMLMGVLDDARPLPKGLKWNLPREKAVNFILRGFCRPMGWVPTALELQAAGSEALDGNRRGRPQAARREPRPAGLVPGARI